MGCQLKPVYRPPSCCLPGYLDAIGLLGCGSGTRCRPAPTKRPGRHWGWARRSQNRPPAGFFLLDLKYQSLSHNIQAMKIMIGDLNKNGTKKHTISILSSKNAWRWKLPRHVRWQTGQQLRPAVEGVSGGFGHPGIQKNHFLRGKRNLQIYKWLIFNLHV